MEKKERRRSERKHAAGAVDFLLIPSSTGEPCSGVLVNKSEQGVCLFTTEDLGNGQRVLIKNGNPRADRIAIVRWSQKCLNLYYRIGLEFEEK